jgi:hypothetical protein
MVTAHHRRSGILIADDSELMRMIVREALERETDFEVCAEAVVSAYAWILSAIAGLDNQSFPLLLVASASLCFQDGTTKRCIHERGKRLTRTGRTTPSSYLHRQLDLTSAVQRIAVTTSICQNVRTIRSCGNFGLEHVKRTTG